MPELVRGGSILTKNEQLKFQRLERLLEAERQRAEKAWVAYRETLYELVDIQMRLEGVQKALDDKFEDDK
jgi:hypothetical protein